MKEGTRGFRSAGLAIVLALAVLLPQSPDPVLAAVGAPKPAPPRPTANLNRFDPRSQAGSVNHLPGSPGTADVKLDPSRPRRPDLPVTMEPALVDLDPDKGVHFVSSDGVLELDAPPGSVTPAEVTASGGRASLLVRQILPASGSSAGGSGHYSFGTYVVQVVDSTGGLAKGLHRPLQLKLHHDKRASALDLGHAFVVVNGSVPTWVNLDPKSVKAKAVSSPSPSAAPSPSPSPSAAPSASPSPTPGPSSSPASSPGARPASATLLPGEDYTLVAATSGAQPAASDPSSGTLTASVAAASASTIVSWNTNAPVAVFGKPDPFNVGLNAGSLTADYPIDIPSGPGGLTPPIQLAYSSAGVNEQHSVQGAAPWVGEGWNLSLGSISWAEHDVLSFSQTYPCVQQGTCVPQHLWEDSWQLSDPFGSGAELVPPNINVSTFLDDTGNGITPSPIQWHTAPETRDKVYSFSSGLQLPGTAAVPPCFRVFRASGIMEEFGCTADSLQYYSQPSGGNQGKPYLANWLLDLIVDSHGNQVHVTYQRDMAAGAGSMQYPRDAVPATVEWDSPNCQDPNHACTGASWAPQMRVNFVAGHTVAHAAGATCAANGNLRCDDPVDLSGSGGQAAPAVQSTFVLNDVEVQVRTSGSASWNTLRDYQLGYDQGGPSSITDPVTGSQESTAGRLLLTQLVEIGDDGSTALPTRSFGYGKLTQYYEDSLALPNPRNNCGPSWNNGNTPNGNFGCLLWSQSYEGNSYYLSTAGNGMGLNQSFSWQDARSNVHGTVSGGSPADPFYCDDSSRAPNYPCNLPDDTEWSRVVLAQGSDKVVRLTQAGQGGSQTSTTVDGTTRYSYVVPYPVSRWCGDCVAGFYWGNQSDWDYLDYYNYRFMGFAQANEARPDGSLDVHKYLSTEGIGIYPDGTTAAHQGLCDAGGNSCPGTAWWHLNNVGHGREVELDRYDTNGTTLLEQVRTQYQAVCPPPGVPATPPNPTYGDWRGNLVSSLDRSNPVAVCDVQTAGVDTYRYDGSGNPSAPHSTTGYGYDSLGRVASETVAGNDGTATGSPGTVVHRTTYVQDDTVNATANSATGIYLIDRVALVDTEDPSGNRYGCSYTSYDGQGFAQGSSGGLTKGDATRLDTYTDCGNAANGFTPGGQISHTKTYDTYGNPLTDTDPDANAGNTAHVGCTVGTTAYSHCAAYDSTFAVLPVSHRNALNQAESTGYQVPATWSSVADWSGNGRNATFSGAQSAQGPGLVTGNGDTSMSFDGATSEVDTPYTQSSAISYTVEAWVQTTDGGVNKVIAQDRGGNPSGGPGKSLTLGLNFTTMSSPGRPFFMVDSDGVAIGVWSSTAVNDGRPHHLVGTWSGGSGAAVTPSQFTLYVDGVAVGVNSIGIGSATAPLSGLGGLKIARHDVWNTFLSGSVGQVAVYTTALSAARVQAHFSAGAGYQSAVQADTPAVYYRLTEGAPAGAGFGLWPASGTDANNQVTGYTYDALGRQTSVSLPAETSGLTTATLGYKVWCSGTAAQAPCIEIDQTQRLNDNQTVTSRAFYDGLGRLVETRTPAPGGRDVVRYRYYDPMSRAVFASVSYFVSGYTGSPGSAAYSIPDSTQAGTTWTYDGLGRVLTSTDALSNRTTSSIGVVCNAAGTGDSACYEQTQSVDPLGHQGGGMVDALGRTVYVQRFTGSSPASYSVYATAKYTYDYAGRLTQILHPDGSSRTGFGYDLAGRKTSISDPDAGNSTYVYDPDGNLVQSVDARGASGTVYAGFDGIDRPIWRNTTNSPTGAYETYSYDDTTGGNLGVGHLTAETFAGIGAYKGARSYVYDARGQLTSSTLTAENQPYSVQSTYDDTGHLLVRTYPSGNQATNGYTAEGWLSSVTATIGSTTTTLYGNLDYQGPGGAAGQVTGAQVGNSTYTAASTYDALLRNTDTKLSRAGGPVLFEQARTLDAAGNVTTATTTMPAGTDNQGFCYDELDRLTWAGTSGTPPCGGSVSSGTLTQAAYTQSFTYDNLGRVTSGPLGTYTYGDPAHLHAATAVGSQYTAAYDASGNMTCRAPLASATCAGATPSGAAITYDNEGRVSSWNDPGSGNRDSFLYDTAGNRTEQEAFDGNGAQLTTQIYVDNLEQVSLNSQGVAISTTDFFYAGGARIAMAVNGTLTYLATDALGSTDVALDSGGNQVASTLNAPYGSVRYSTGTMPADYQFTGQRHDSITGLEYFNARYYDSAIGQFISADDVIEGGGFDILGLSAYAYVEGNPIGRTDPSGHSIFDSILGGARSIWSWVTSGISSAWNRATGGASAWGGSVGGRVSGIGGAIQGVIGSIGRVSGGAHIQVIQPTGPRCCTTPIPPPGPKCCTTVIPSPGPRCCTTPIPPPGPKCCSTPIQKPEPRSEPCAVLGGILGMCAGPPSGGIVVNDPQQPPPGIVNPGPQAGDPVPAPGPGRDFPLEIRDIINNIGQKLGCHTCGSKDPGTVGGNFVPDHQPPTGLNPDNRPQNLYPQCLQCSRVQGGWVRVLKGRLGL